MAGGIARQVGFQLDGWLESLVEGERSVVLPRDINRYRRAITVRSQKVVDGIVRRREREREREGSLAWAFSVIAGIAASTIIPKAATATTALGTR